MHPPRDLTNRFGMIAGDTLLAALTEHWVPQADKPEETPSLTLRALWFAAAGDPRGIDRVAGTLPALDATGEHRLEELVRERVQGTPLAHLTGRQSFFGLELLAHPDALIPRRETEILVAAALARLESLTPRARHPLVLDLCTGSGNVALSLAMRVPAARIIGSDLSPGATALAQRNARHLACDDRVSFRTGDLFAPFEGGDFAGAADLITCNPPYISSGKVPRMSREIAEHEPSLAFDGGPFGVNLLLRMLAQAPRFLAPGGWLACEIGLGQGPGVLGRLERMPEYTEISTLNDASGDVRALVARRTGTTPDSSTDPLR